MSENKILSDTRHSIVGLIYYNTATKREKACWFRIRTTPVYLILTVMFWKAKTDPSSVVLRYDPNIKSEGKSPLSRHCWNEEVCHSTWSWAWFSRQRRTKSQGWRLLGHPATDNTGSSSTPPPRTWETETNIGLLSIPGTSKSRTPSVKHPLCCSLTLNQSAYVFVQQYVLNHDECTKQEYVSYIKKLI